MSYKNEAINFLTKMEYKDTPYSSRNWGHPWHSLCSYHGKLKPAIAHLLIKNFTKEGDRVLDPLSGVGTIPFEACLQNRIGLGSDLSKFAYFVTKAKVSTQSKIEILERLDELNKLIKESKDNYTGFEYNDFGLNGTINDYFELETLKEILCLRQVFINKKIFDNIDFFIITCFLHILHGNRPYALSRNSHPLTPYFPKGDFKYKSVIEHIKNKVVLSFSKRDNYILKNGNAFNLDFRELNVKLLNGKVDAIITSPPFTNSFKFYTQNWMRLWLIGWEKQNFKEVDPRYLEIEQKYNLDIYYDFFKICYALLKNKGKLILHLGKTTSCDMAEELSKRCEFYFNEIYRGEEYIGNIEKHGIKDKGSTTDHQFLFLQKK